MKSEKKKILSGKECEVMNYLPYFKEPPIDVIKRYKTIKRYALKLPFRYAHIFRYLFERQIHAVIVVYIAKTIFSVGCDLGRFNSSTALGASYIGNPKLRLTSAIYAVCTLKP